MGDRWSMGRRHVQRPECKELPGPQEREEGGVFLHGQRGRQMEQGIAWAGPGDHFTAGEAEAWRKSS